MSEVVLMNDARIRLLAAVKAYELEELTSGQAAELAGMSKLAFLQKLGEFKVSLFDMTREELEHDLEVARKLREG